MDENESTSHIWQPSQSFEDWHLFIQRAQTILGSSSTNLRVRFLREDLLGLVNEEGLGLNHKIEVFGLMARTYPRYIDATSRNAVEAVVMRLVEKEESEDADSRLVTKQIVSWLADELSRICPGSYTPSDSFILLNWTCGIYTLFPGTSTSQVWKQLVGILAALLDHQLNPSTHTKPAMQKSALNRTRQAFRLAPERLPLLMATLIELANSSQVPLVQICLLGVAVEVALGLKSVKDESLNQIPYSIKEDIIALYTAHVLMSRSPVPAHISGSLHHFIHSCISPTEFTSLIFPIMDKALLRSPECSFDVIRKFFLAYSHPMDPPALNKLLMFCISSAKSGNPMVRAGAIALFETLLINVPLDILDSIVLDVLALLQAGKTTGPDHRMTLYVMLSMIRPSTNVSFPIMKALLPSILKEASDSATATLTSTLSRHLTYLLEENVDIPTVISSAIAKELNNVKPTLRKAFVVLVGTAIWSLSGLDTTSAISFMEVVTSPLEANLRGISANPLGAASSPLEGYVVLTVLLGPMARSGKFVDMVSRNTSVDLLVGTPSKPSFILWEKVYQRVTDADGELWLLRCIDLVAHRLNDQLLMLDSLRTQVGSVFVYLAVHSQFPDIRRATIRTLEMAVSRQPKLFNLIIKESLASTLCREKSSPPKVADTISSELEQPAMDKQGRYAALLLCCSNLRKEEGSDVTLRSSLLADLAVLAHHPAISAPSRHLWIELCQKAGVDPHDLICKHIDLLMKSVLEASMMDPKSGFVEASYHSISALTFVCPEVVLPRVMNQLHADINVPAINELTEMDFGIYETPEGETYVNVLPSQKREDSPKKGKDAEIAKWEAELRQSLAGRGSGAPVRLSKQEQALLQAQLEKEAPIRQRVASLKANLQRSLAVIRSVMSANVPESSEYVQQIATLLLQGALGRATRLVGSEAFETFTCLAQCCSERLDVMRKWVAVAIIRVLQLPCVPEELQTEPLHSLVLRVLYRLRTLSEQAPFDAASFAFVFPLLGRILHEGGIDVPDEEERLEQVTLVLDILKFHCSEFSNPKFPRKAAMEEAIHVLRSQPRLSKDTSSVLVDLGEIVQSTATGDEISVLIFGTLVQEAHVRNTCLQAIQPFDLTDLDWSPELWVACHGTDEQSARLANHVWEDNGLDVPEDFLGYLLPFLSHENAYVRTGAASAIAGAIEHVPQASEKTILTLQDLYREKVKILAPEYDEYGMVIPETLDRLDPWPTRVAVALALGQLARAFPDSHVEAFFIFLIKEEALGDRSPEVRRAMLEAGTAVVDHRGAAQLAGLLAVFEDHLAKPASATASGDQIKEAVVILLGRVARHLNASDSRIPAIMDRLSEALKTPAEQVQLAVSDCLVPLIKLMGGRTDAFVDHLFDELFDGAKYAARRGGAYGLAGVIKGLGIGTMKRFDVINRLHAAAEDKKRFESRQGAMLAFETLSYTLGRLFEPYITFVLPRLLTAFGDGAADVRETAQDAARVIMGNMSGYGVKLILPSLLSGLDEKQWRSKKGSIELLGMMAYCSPRQLSLSLPIVIPRLTNVLTDTHSQVKVAANKSLKQFGEVISNPEIQALVPTLLKAMVDPTKTTNALTSLLKTSFIHYIDHSSLALVIPVVERGLRERGAEGKKKAAQLVGNLASLTDSKDFVPYLSTLLPMVHIVLTDPVPEARATAARSLGVLVERLGEDHFPDLVPSLLRTLKAEKSGVDRQGAAQGLSEVLSGLGMERLEGLLPDIIANAQSPRSTVREGFMSLLVYLPATFGARFQPHLPKIIAPILRGLADNEEYVHDAAMRAGRMMVAHYSTKAIDLLLPELEHGMFDPGWRIRQSSITLVGELLFKVSGITGKTEGDQEEVGMEPVVAESSRRALTEVLGEERRDRILSALYLARQDAVNVVRQSSIQIWKALVHNTPRTVREILPGLVKQLIKLYAGGEDDQQETAARTTLELSRKFGEKLIGEILTVLKTMSTSPDVRTREGVCLMLADIVQSTTDTQREGHESEIVSVVRTSLVDDDASVRSAAAKAFDTLQDHIGGKAIDQIIPTLLEALRRAGESSGTALQALREIMSVRASTVFPVLIPNLISMPMTPFGARALASLVTVAGDALSKRLSVILGALVRVFEEDKDEELLGALDEALRALLGSIQDAEGLNTLMLLLLGWAKHNDPRRRASACAFFALFCEESEMDSSIYRVDWIRELISLFDDSDLQVHTAAWQAFDTFVRSTPKGEYESLVVALRRAIEGTGAPGRTVWGFSLPKGVAPTVPIIIAGLTAGNNEQRENAAYAIGDLVQKTDESVMKAFVVPFAGPLIRVATQATSYPPGVKTAILSALACMLESIPNHVRPFFPQLQRTFVKSVSDPSSIVVRTRAAEALGVLMRSQPRIDPVITELVTGAQASEEEIAASFVLALSYVVRSANAHSSIGDKAGETCAELVKQAFLENHDDHYINAAGSLFVSLSKNTELVRPVVSAYLVSQTPLSPLSSHMILATLEQDEGSDHVDPDETVFTRLGVLRSVALKVKESAASERPNISRPAREAREILKQLAARGEESLVGMF